MTNLSSVLDQAASDYPERPAIRLDDLVLSYGELHAAAGRMAALLPSLGVVPGDRVAIMLPNVPAFPIAFYGALAAGAVVVPMNPLLKSREVAFYLKDSGAKVLFVWSAVAEEGIKGADQTDARVIEIDEPDLATMLAGLDPVPSSADRADEDDAVILYTSGTTGWPKGAQLTQANVTRNARDSGTNLFGIGPDDVVMGCLPLFHIFGLTCGLNATIIKGGTLTLLTRFDPAKALEVIGRDKVTIFEGVPTMYAAMLHHPTSSAADVTSLRLCCSGGSAMPVGILRGFEKAFGCVILEGYGLSETSPVVSFNHLNRERKPGSIGTPIADVEMRLVGEEGAAVPVGEVGEIAIRGYNVMKGYWGNPDATAESFRDGWFLTGDLAKVDDEGYYYIVDRKKDLIIRGGLNVYPREVEEVLYEHPAVAEAAVVGIPHDDLGEEIGAAVALKPGHTATADELRAFVKERVAPYKYPRYVWLQTELPKGASGKIIRREVEQPEDLTTAAATT